MPGKQGLINCLKNARIVSQENGEETMNECDAEIEKVKKRHPEWFGMVKGCQSLEINRCLSWGLQGRTLNKNLAITTMRVFGTGGNRRNHEEERN